MAAMLFVFLVLGVVFTVGAWLEKAIPEKTVDKLFRMLGLE